MAYDSTQQNVDDGVLFPYTQNVRSFRKLKVCYLKPTYDRRCMEPFLAPDLKRAPARLGIPSTEYCYAKDTGGDITPGGIFAVARLMLGIQVIIARNAHVSDRFERDAWIVVSDLYAKRRRALYSWTKMQCWRALADVGAEDLEEKRRV